MPVLPDGNQAQIEFCEYHTDLWDSAPAAIGLTAGQITAMKDITDFARTSFDAAAAARSASKAATTTLNGNMPPMRAMMADLIRQIKAFAELQTKPSDVYAAAEIPMPLPPTPLPAPGKPTNMQVNLQTDGSITLSWEALGGGSAASSGAFYNITRKLPGQTSYSNIGGAPGSTTESRRMSFTDATVPTSAAGSGAQYIIRGQRGTLLGEASDAITVQFGVDGEGSFAVGGSSSTLKMAA